MLQVARRGEVRRSSLSGIRRAARSGSGGEEPVGLQHQRVSSRRSPNRGPTRGSQNVFVNRRIVKDQDDRPRDHRGLQQRLDQRAKPRGSPVPRDSRRSRRRERAPDEGRSAVPRSVVRPRSREARRSPTRLARARCRSCSCSRRPIASRARWRSRFPVC